MTRLAPVFLGLFLLASCSSNEPDLKEQLRSLTKDFRGRVDPLPRLAPVEAISYDASELPDPFYPGRRP